MKTLIIKIAVLLGLFPMASQAETKVTTQNDNTEANNAEALLSLQFGYGYFKEQKNGSILIDQDYKNEVLKGYIHQEKYATEVVDLLKGLLSDEINVIGLDDVDLSVMATQDWVIEN